MANVNPNESAGEHVKASPAHPHTPQKPYTLKNKLYAWIYITVAINQTIRNLNNAPAALKKAELDLKDLLPLFNDDGSPAPLHGLVSAWVNDMTDKPAAYEVSGALLKASDPMWSGGDPHPTTADLDGALGS